MWMNNKILVGVGKKLESKLFRKYYELVHGSGSPPDTYNLNVEYIFSMKLPIGGSVKGNCRGGVGKRMEELKVTSVLSDQEVMIVVMSSYLKKIIITILHLSFC